MAAFKERSPELDLASSLLKLASAVVLYSAQWTYYRDFLPKVSRVFCPLGRMLYNGEHGLDEDEDRGLRCLRTSVDSRNREPAKLPLEEVPFNALE